MTGFHATLCHQNLGGYSDSSAACARRKKIRFTDWGYSGSFAAQSSNDGSLKRSRSLRLVPTGKTRTSAARPSSMVRSNDHTVPPSRDIALHCPVGQWMQQEFYQLLSYKGHVDLEAKLDE